MSKATYGLTIKKQAIKALKKMPRQQAERITDLLEKLAENPDRRDVDIAPLIARPGFRLRVGSLRVIFKRDNTARAIEVTRIASRGQAYKQD